MANLPVIVGFGGINAAGRSSFHHGYRRLVIDAIAKEKADLTVKSLTRLMGLADQPLNDQVRLAVLDGTLVRQLDENIFDPNNIAFNARLAIEPCDGDALCFELPVKNLPEPIPEHWRIERFKHQLIVE